VLAEHYFCTVCEKYFDMDMQEIDEDDVIEGEALGHGYGELIAEQPATETAEGMKAHYECSRCHALFDTEKNEVEREALVIPALEPEAPKEPEGNKPEENEPNENEGGSTEKPTEKPTDKPTDKPTETEAPSGTLPADGEKSGCSSLLGGASVLVAVALIGSAAVMIKRKED
jgi:DNA-directed RNA polymerase subunit RPC12/RpoP